MEDRDATAAVSGGLRCGSVMGATVRIVPLYYAKTYRLIWQLQTRGQHTLGAMRWKSTWP